MGAKLTTKEAAERLGVNASRVRQLILAGKLPSEKFGRDRMIDEDDLSKVKTYGTVGRPPKSQAA
jgi:excisionase family DNA binding protein